MEMFPAGVALSPRDQAWGQEVAEQGKNMSFRAAASANWPGHPEEEAASCPQVSAS
jgi:hypothetical protein